MANSFHNRFPLKPQSLHKLFSNFFPFSDRFRGVDIDGDWEIIDMIDEEINSNEEGKTCDDDKVSDCNDDDFYIPSPYLPLPNHKIKYKILSRAEVLQHIEDKISRISSVFLLSRSEATTLLQHFKWCVMRTEDEWLTNEEKVRKTVGLFRRPIVAASDISNRVCGICQMKVPDKIILKVSCGHRFCRWCWTGYIGKAISDGGGCLSLRCPGGSCDAAVERDLIELLSSQEEKNKFEYYLITSYLLANKEAKWCPSPGCDYVVFLLADGDESIVTCRCSYRFCWKCTRESHTPVDCETVDKWVSVICVQSENQLLADTEPYSIFRCQIQDNEEKKHPDSMWICDNGSSLPTECHEDNERERGVAKLSYYKYINFVEGWITNESSRASAEEQLKLFQNINCGILHGIYCLTEKEIKCVVDAQHQLVECYQILKWTNVYDFFMSEDEYNKKCLLEFMQEQAKNLTQLLKKQVEKLEDFLYLDVGVEQFRDFHKKLQTLTRVNKDYFDKMTDALRAGLPEVVDIQRLPPQTHKRKEPSDDDSPYPSLSPNSKSRKEWCKLESDSDCSP